jgi:hypothetical protein
MKKKLVICFACVKNAIRSIIELWMNVIRIFLKILSQEKKDYLKLLELSKQESLDKCGQNG